MEKTKVHKRLINLPIKIDMELRHLAEKERRSVANLCGLLIEHTLNSMRQKNEAEADAKTDY